MESIVQFKVENLSKKKADKLLKERKEKLRKIKLKGKKTGVISRSVLTDIDYIQWTNHDNYLVEIKEDICIAVALEPVYQKTTKQITVNFDEIVPDDVEIVTLDDFKLDGKVVNIKGNTFFMDDIRAKFKVIKSGKFVVIGDEVVKISLFDYQGNFGLKLKLKYGYWLFAAMALNDMF